MRREYAFLLGIIVLGLVLRLFKINAPVADWHSWRQADTASVTRFYARDGIDLLRPRYHDISDVPTGYQNPEGWRFVEFPIYNATHALFSNNFAFWSLERWGRTLSALFSVLSIIFLYSIGKRFLGVFGGLITAFFFAVLPFNVFFSRVILPEPMAVMFATFSLWAFIRWIDAQRSFFIFASAASFALAMLVKPFTAFWGIPMLYLSFEKFGLRGMFSQAKLWMFFSISLTPVFAWRAWMNNFLEGIPHAEWLFNGDGIRFKPSWWWWIFGERLGRLVLGGWALIPFAAGLMDKNKGKFPWFIHSFIASQVVYFSVVATANVRHDYYQTLSIPAVSLVLAAGFVYLWRARVFNQDLRRLTLVGAVGLGLAFSAFQVREFYKINHPEIIIAGQAADKLLPQEARVIAPYNGDTAFLYQTRRRGWPYVTLPMQEMIEKLGAQYYVSVNFDDQTNELMGKYKVLEKTDRYVIIDLRNPQ